jgi:hypothetical protein
MGYRIIWEVVMGILWDSGVIQWYIQLYIYILYLNNQIIIANIRR